MSRCRVLAGVLSIALAALVAPVPASAISGDEFRLRSGADLVALCAAPATDPLYTAAVHMCHGFGAGTYQTLVAVTRHEKLQPILCPPEPVPSRNETVRRFLEWAGRNPQHLQEPPAETVGRFLVTEFPCRPR